MKIAVTGKGGVGKTTLSALLARAIAEDGKPVIAIDADPAANLASALGLPVAEWPEAISRMKRLIAERTGAEEGYGKFFKLNPDVADLPAKYSKTIHGVRVLVLGGVSTGGSGCLCPENALLQALVTHMLLKPDETVILDMEAGIEHLGRGTADAVSMMIIVVEPGARSIQTAATIRRLAADIRMPRLGIVFSKVPLDAPTPKATGALEGLPVLGRISLDPGLVQAEIEGKPAWTGRDPQRSEVQAILSAVRATPTS